MLGFEQTFEGPNFGMFKVTFILCNIMVCVTVLVELCIIIICKIIMPASKDLSMCLKVFMICKHTVVHVLLSTMTKVNKFALL